MIFKRFMSVLSFWLALQSGWVQAGNDVAPATRLLAAQFEYGRDGVKQDYRQAFQLYCQAALQGDAESAYRLGFMYFNGRGKPHRLDLAMNWFKQAADLGDADAPKMLARYRDVVPMDDDDCPTAEKKVQTLIDETTPHQAVIKAWVEQIAPRYAIDPELVMAVIRVESAYNPQAVSDKHAQGLMQLIPETAARFGVKDVWDPVENIEGGTAYLHWLLRHFQGRVDWVLAAYNAGEGAVERYRGIPPYRETQNYVRRVQVSYSKSFHPVPPARFELKSMDDRPI